MLKTIIDKTIKSIGIASAGGGLTLGAGTINLVDVDFPTIIVVAFASVVFNTFYVIIKEKGKQDA